MDFPFCCCLAVKVIDVIKKDILSASTKAPKAFLEKLTSIFYKGSIHSAADQFNGMEGRVSLIRGVASFRGSVDCIINGLSLIRPSLEPVKVP